MKPCEMCDSLEGIRRDDNIHVCNRCNDKYPMETSGTLKFRRCKYETGLTKPKNYEEINNDMLKEYWKRQQGA